MKNVKSIGVLLVVLLSGFIFGSCEIGLGSAVDTEPPSVSIETPGVDVVIRDNFAIKGTWSDDGEIESLTAVLERTDGLTEPFEFAGEVATNEGDDNSGTWKILVDPKAQGILDGTYQVTISIKDKGEHVTTQTRTFTIDNTAPLIVLQRPSSKSDSTSVDSYGQSFTLTGQAADDNNVSLIKVKIYSDPECTSLIHTVDLKNVPPTIELDVAKFVEGEQNDYSKIYGSTTKDGEKQFYCAIEAYDGAQRYPIEGNQSAADTSGNYTTSYYLYEDIATQILSEYSVTNVYHMYSGTYTNVDGSRAADISNSVKEILAEKVINAGSFSLNPANNPTFAVSGRDQLKKDGTDFSSVVNNISNDSDLIIEVSVGLDAIPLVADSLRVYLQKCDDNGATVTSEKYYPTNSTKQKSGTSYKFVTHIKKDELVDANGNAVNVNYGDRFIVGVEGKDEKDTPIVASGKGYGVKLAASGAAPILDVRSFVNPTATTTDAEYTDDVQFAVARYKDNRATVKEDTVIRLKGYTQVEEGEPTFRILVDNTPLTGVSLTPDATVGKFTFEKDITSSLFTNPGVNGQHSIKIESEQNLKSTVTLTVIYDVEEPTIKVISVTPTAYKYEAANEAKTKSAEKYLNGNINIDISLQDSGRSDIYIEEGVTPKVEFIQNGVIKDTIYFTSSESTGKTITNFNTVSKLEDNKPVTIRITAKDGAGNTSVKDELYNVCQDTDKPVLLPYDNSESGVTLKSDYEPTGADDSHKKNLFSESQSFMITVIDDDGIGSVELKIYKESDLTTPYKTISRGNNDIHGATEYQLDAQAPDIAGTFIAKISAKDVNTVPSVEKTFKIRVTKAAPTVSSRITNKDKASKNGNVANEVKLTVNISSDQKPFTLYRTIKNSSGTAITGQSHIEVAGTSILITDNPIYTDTINVKNLNLDSGTYTVVYSAEDSNEKEGSESVATTFYVDNDAPTITTGDSLKVPSVTETESTNSSFTFIGSANTGDEVYQSLISKVELTFTDGSATTVPTSPEIIEASGTTSWNKEVVFGNYKGNGAFFATEGSKKLWVRATDEVGNVGNWVSKPFNYDTAKPEITFTNKPTKLGVNSLTLNGTIIEKNGFANGTKLKVTEKVDNTDPKTFDITLGSSTNGVYPWSVSIPLEGHGSSSGTFSYTFEIKDKVGKELSNNNTFNADRDLEPPVITLTAPNNTTYGDASISKSDTVIKGNITETFPRNIYYKVFKKGTTEPTVYTTVDISQVSDSWTFSVDNLSEGENTIKLYADDTSGNTCSVITQDFMVDKNPPEITYYVYKVKNDDTEELITNSDKLESVNVTDGKAFVLKGKISDTNGIESKSIKINDSESGVDYNSSTGEWRYPLSGTPAEGTYNCKIEVTDVSGNGKTGTQEIKGKTATLTRKVVFDKTEPTGTVNVSGWLKSQGETYVTGTASDGTTGSGVADIKFTLKKDSTVIIDKAAIPLSSSWSYSFDVDNLTESTSSTDVYTIVLDLKDNVGLTNQITETFSLDRSIPVVDSFTADRNYISNVSGAQNSVKFTGAIFDGEKTAYRSVSKAYLAAYKKGSNGTYELYNLTGTDTEYMEITPASAHSTDDEKAGFGKFETTISLTGTNDKLSEGEYKFKIIGEDLSGRTCSSSEIALVVDNTPPTATFNESSFSPVAKPVSSIKWYNKNSIKINVTVAENYLQTIEASGNASASTPDWSPLSKDSTTGNYEGYVSSLAEGDNTITLKMVDLAGNTNTAALQVKVDTKAPDTCTADNSGTILCQGESAFTFYVTIADVGADATSGSGIKSATLTKVADLTKNIAGTKENGKYKFTIPANTSGQQNNQKEGMVEITVEDNVGNKQSFQVFKLDVDSEAPTISFSSIANGGTVNGKINISGTASDNKTLSSVKVERQTGADTWTEVGTMSGSVYSWSYANINTDTEDFISYDADSSTVGKQVKLRATATDESGRIETETITVTVDQDTDRPVIKFSNLTQINGAYYLKYGTNAQLEGTITDDDSTTSAVIDTFIVSTSSVTSPTGWIKGGTGDTVTYTKGTEVTTYNKKTGEFTFKPSNTADGAKTIYFYVKDNGGTEFYTANATTYTTATTIKKQVYYQNKTDTSTKTVSAAAVTYTSDGESPTVTSKQIQAYKGSTTNGDPVTPGTSVIVGGTEKNKIQFIVKANDASGIASMEIELKNAEGNSLKKLKSSVAADGTFEGTSNGSSDATWTTTAIDISGWTSGSVSLAITATDNCGLHGNANEVFMVDNIGPVINISSPLSTEEVTAAVSVTGQATDSSSGSKEIKFLIPTSAQRTAQASSGKSAEEYYKTVTTGWEGKLHGDTTVNAFEFLFNNETLTDNNSLNYYTKDGTATYGLSSTEDVYTIPIYFKATDNLGNVSVKEYSIKYNPDADKPKTEISYPSSKDYDTGKTYVTLGGSIRVTGSITIPSMTTTPDKVYIQIADENGAFNATDKTKAGSGTGNYGYTVKDITNVETDIGKSVLGLSTSARSSWWGIQATRSSNAWSIILNDNKQLEKTGGNTIKIRACGINAEGKMGSWSEAVTIKVDADAPTYTSKLYQFTGTPAVGSQTAEREYEPGIFLKGQWYIGAHIEDKDKVVVENAKKDGALLTEDTDYWVSTATDNKSADVFIKLDATATELKTYTISARDAAEGNYHYVTPSYEVNVDNTAPTIEAITSGDGYPISMTKQSASNYVTTFGSSSVDAGSGVSRIAFYFKRESENGSKIELPIPAEENAAQNKWKIGTAYSDALTTTSDNMYGVNVTGTKGTGTGTTTFTASSSISGYTFIRAGGLVQILGTYYKIASVSGNEVTVNTEISSSFTQAFFPAVMVVDNSSSENTSWSSGVNTQKGDDGDGMVESFKKAGTTWTWDASIYSSELADGEVTLVCVAFDVAGNSAKLETNFMFANKTPRLNKVFLATDLNGDGKFAETEQGTSVITSSGAKTVERYYSALNAGSVQDVLTIYGNTSDTENSTTESGITMRDKLGVAFEFVSGYEGYGAGQGDIYYKMSVSNAAITAPETATSLTTKLSTTSSPFQADSCKSLKYMTAETTGFSTTTQTGKLKYTEDALNYIHLTLWDSSNSKQGTLDVETTPVSYKNAAGDNLTVNKYESFGAQWTVVNIPLKMDLVDGIAPTVTIEHPEAEETTGHVDLGSTLTGFTGSNEFDTDDKVSGLVTFDVTVKDEKRINSLKLNTNFGGTATDYTIGSYSNGAFAITAATPVTGITFAIAEQTFDIATGHTIKFNVTIDTTKVNGGAKANVTFTLTANDGTNNGTDANQMDVVPYITGVSRADTTVNTYRSKLGKYQVVIGETLNVTGFNLPTGDTYYRVLSSAVTTKSVPNTNKITSSDGTATGAKLTAPGNSGYVVAVTNGVSSLNNMNNNAQDNNKQTGTMANASDTWTDDVYLSAWKNDEYFYFSNDPISPAMDAIAYSRTSGRNTYNLRRLYGGWGSNSSQFLASYAAENGTSLAPSPASGSSDTSTGSENFGDPATFYDVIIDGSNRYNLLIDCWQGNNSGTTGYWGKNFVLNKNGIYTHNGCSSNTTVNDTNIIERMGSNKIPGQDTSSTGYDSMFNQFLNPRVAYKNNYGYVTYYDRYAKCLKFASIQFNNNNNNKANKYATEGNYTNGKYVVAGYETLQNGGSKSALDVGLWSAIGVDSASGVTDSPVIAYYDSKNRCLMIATAKTRSQHPENSNNNVLRNGTTISAPTGGTNPGEGNAWNRTKVTDSDKYRLGQYVSMVVDAGNNLHIAAYGTAGGNKLYYIYGARSAYGTYTFTTTCVDAEGAGTWTDIQLEDPTKSGAAAKPVISYYDPSNDSSENAIKVAYLENGVWDTMTAPLKSSAVSNRVTLALDVTDGDSLASATANNSKLAVGYVSSRFDCIYLRKE